MTEPPAYNPPPSSGGGDYPPPSSGGGAYPPPTSGGGAYPPPGGGYGPPAGGYPPGGGYPGGGGGYPPGGGYGGPSGYANPDEKTWALIAHWGGAAGAFIAIWLGFVAPLVAMMGRGTQSPTVRAHAVEALNFHLTWIGVSVALFLVLCCGTVVTLGIGGVFFFLMGAPWLVAVIFGIIGGVKANDGQLYRYPMTVRLIK
jgi:uncharacterized Tic20 family protein